MSMNTKIIYGYGVDMSVVDVEFNTFLSFFKKHLPEEYEETIEFAESEGIDTENIDEEFKDLVYEYASDYYDSSDSCSFCSFFPIIAHVMSEETGIRIESIASEDDRAIMFPETLPWLMNETEKALTEEKLCEIFKKYFAELGVDVDPNRVRVEFYEDVFC